MNTPTPRTDAQYKEYARRDNDVKCVDINFARQLKRELTNVTQLHEIAMGGWKSDRQDRDEWKAIAEELATTSQYCLDNAHWEVRDGSGELRIAIARFNAKKGQQ